MAVAAESFFTKIGNAGRGIADSLRLPGTDALPGVHEASNVRRTVVYGLVLVAIVFGGIGTWITFANLAGAVVATGTVKVDLNRKTIQHLEGGIVKEILVRDGDKVKAGQPLIVLGDVRISATVEVLEGQLYAEQAKAARLIAEREQADHIEFPAELAAATDPRAVEAMKTESTFFETKRRVLLDQIALLKDQAKEASSEIGSLSQRADAEVAAAALLQQEVEANEKIEAEHYVSKVHVLGLKRGIEDYKARRGEHLANMAQTRQRIIDLELRTVGLRDKYIQEAAAQLTEVEAKIYDLEERLRPSVDALERQHIVAPISGTVVDLKVFTIGGVIAPREPLMDIVPADNPMIIEAEIPLDSIDDIHVGQEADIRLSAYKRRSTPLVYGKLIYVSADRLADRSGEKQYYLARIEVTPESLAEAGNLHMSPGMPAEIFIRTGDRTALDYMLAPITASLRRSFREP